MKSHLILICFVLFTFCNHLYSQNSNTTYTRVKEKFNDNWKFVLADSIVYNEPNFDDSKWTNLNLPHDWSITEKFDSNNSGRNAWLPGGIGWYRKQFVLPQSFKNKHISIQFDGVYRHSEIWVNGEHVGVQYDGFTSFHFDITPFVEFGKPNIVALRVDNSIQPNCRWYTGSGIYRNVWISITEQLHIGTWGTYITTPKISKEAATIAINTTIENFGNAAAAKLVSTIYNEENNVVAETITSLNVNLKKTYEINQKLVISNPKLWDLNSPYLYDIVSQIIVNDKVVDDYVSSFGVRSIKFDAKSGFFLNNRNIKLKGVCLHQDAGALGAVVPIEIWKTRLKLLKDIGCNSIRMAHNPSSPELMNLCDEMGFLVINEFVDKWYDNEPYNKNQALKSTFFNPKGFGDPNFYLEWEKNYKNTILRDRNHPSVIIWSVGNENHSPGDARQILGLRKHTRFVRNLDPTRPVISGMERGKDVNPKEKISAIIETCKEMDLIALNYGEQWCKSIGDENPGKPYVSTESYIYFNSTPEKRFANIERAPWLDVLDNSFNMGLFLWSGIDYLGESKKYPKIGSSSGLINSAGMRKEVSYLYQAFWSSKPMVKIAIYQGDADDFSTSGRWSAPPTKTTWNLEKGKKYDIVTYTNCESVDLYVNEKKIGNKKLKDFSNWIMKWRKIQYQPGKIKAIGINNGIQVCEYEIVTTGKPHQLSIKELINDDIIELELALVDKKGKIVNTDNEALNLKLEGEGVILASFNGNTKDIESFSNPNFCITNNGKCRVIVKPNGKKGPLKLLVTSKYKKTHYVIK